ncbi:hypothetical protein AYO21_09277 [Fonsecaea monophora]|uniref:Uncharacterized protein n=1 Tax=Fonsecaea monophora TaxID=254056 RepID=A0A177EY68_9EURO|nr:hypothetical protein AYO21_09277 [Fonsecaea monophora]KAH0829913.1 hypothetical protein FOPE_10788 [Fonsecaea pedrosoi]OAG36546.1 hypothetical protein AYO21_09277 [Fonsecaea monophora]
MSVGSNGSNAGGSNTGGSNAGGFNAGGFNAGGSNTGGSNAGGSNTDGSNSDGSNTDGSNTDGSNTGGSNTMSYRFTYTTCPLHEYSKISARDGRGPIWICRNCDGVHAAVWECTLCGHNLCPRCLNYSPQVDGPQVDGPQVDGPQVDGIEATNRARFR